MESIRLCIAWARMNWNDNRICCIIRCCVIISTVILLLLNGVNPFNGVVKLFLVLLNSKEKNNCHLTSVRSELRYDVVYVPLGLILQSPKRNDHLVLIDTKNKTHLNV